MSTRRLCAFRAGGVYLRQSSAAYELRTIAAELGVLGLRERSNVGKEFPQELFRLLKSREVAGVHDQVEVFDGRNNVIKESLCLLGRGQKINLSLEYEKRDFKPQALFPCIVLKDFRQKLLQTVARAAEVGLCPVSGKVVSIKIQSTT